MSISFDDRWFIREGASYKICLPQEVNQLLSIIAVIISIIWEQNNKIGIPQDEWRLISSMGLLHHPHYPHGCPQFFIAVRSDWVPWLIRHGRCSLTLPPILPICYQAELPESGLMVQFGQFSNRFSNKTKGNTKLSISLMKDVQFLLFKVCRLREQGKLDPSALLSGGYESKI